MNVGVFGLGRFGSFWSSVLSRRFEVRGYDIDPSRPTLDGVARVGLSDLARCDTVFLCVAIRAVPEALASIAPHLGAGSLVADTCSVKSQPARWMIEGLPAGVGILATHPMFGPESAKNGLAGLPIMMDPVRCTEDRAAFWEAAFAGFGLSVVRMSCEQHDREAAYSQALTHFVGRSLHRVGLPNTEIATRWYQKLHAVAQQCVRDSPALFADMQHFNPYTEEMRRTVLHAFAETLRELGDPKAAGLDELVRSPVDSKQGAPR